MALAETSSAWVTQAETKQAKEGEAETVQTKAVGQGVATRRKKFLGNSQVVTDADRAPFISHKTLANRPFRPVTTVHDGVLLSAAHSPQDEGSLAGYSLVRDVARHVKFLEGFAIAMGPDHPEVDDLAC